MIDHISFSVNNFEENLNFYDPTLAILGYERLITFDNEIALELIKARLHSKMTQQEVASRMGTTQSVVARLESGRTTPSIKTLERYAQATGKHLHVNFN
jgi:DNA-binding XRE family transcriptional regulator